VNFFILREIVPSSPSSFSAISRLWTVAGRTKNRAICYVALGQFDIEASVNKISEAPSLRYISDLIIRKLGKMTF
jgi:hypothetical protein